VRKVKPILDKISSKTPKSQRTKPKYKAFQEHIMRDTEQSHILMGFEAPHLKHPLRFASYIVNTALGGGMTSLLYQEIREKKGLAYTVYSMISNGTDSGQSLIYAGADPDKVEKVKDIIYANLKKIKTEGFNKNLLERFKTQITGFMIINEDDLESRMTSLCLNEMVFGKYRSTEDVIKSIQETSLKDIRDYIDQYIDLDMVSVLTLGPKG
jgi:predicted Zn-dependent peptidase